MQQNSQNSSDSNHFKPAKFLTTVQNVTILLNEWRKIRLDKIRFFWVQTQFVFGRYTLVGLDLEVHENMLQNCVEPLHLQVHLKLMSAELVGVRGKYWVFFAAFCSRGCTHAIDFRHVSPADSGTEAQRSYTPLTSMCGCTEPWSLLGLSNDSCTDWCRIIQALDREKKNNARPVLKLY